MPIITLNRSHPQQTLRDSLLQLGYELPSRCAGQGACGLCQVQLAHPAPAANSNELKHLSQAQLQAGWRLACQHIIESDLTVHAPDSLFSTKWRHLRTDELDTPKQQLASSGQYGIAVDLGTTHIRISLCDLVHQQRIAAYSGLNPQRVFGADVLSRLMEATRAPVFATQMASCVQQAIAQAIQQLLHLAPIATARIQKVTIVGNTAMLTLLSGSHFEDLLQPEYWTEPIIPAPISADKLGLDADTSVQLLAPLGGFIGSDIWAGIVATRLHERPAGALLIDFGTNTEMALWDGKQLHLAAAAGGPAFEGAGVSCGMPAEEGAIYRVTSTSDYQVINATTAQGICGSGLVDVLAYLRQSGQLDRIGRLNQPSIALGPLQLHKRDIDLLQRAKAAIGAGIRCLCSRANIPMHKLTQVYACGAFGHLLNIQHAQAIGLLPNIPTQHIQLLGHSALLGCELLMFEPHNIMPAMQIYNLASEEDFENLFIESLYLEALKD